MSQTPEEFADVLIRNWADEGEPGQTAALIAAANPAAIIAVLDELAAARGALERLGSMEAFCGARAVTKHPADEELLARIDYARAHLPLAPGSSPGADGDR